MRSGRRTTPSARSISAASTTSDPIVPFSSPSWSTAATRTPTTSSSSRSSPPAPIGWPPQRSNRELAISRSDAPVIDKSMRAATTMVQGSQGLNKDAEPLTTPIYETTTFLFENAAEVTAYNEGRSKKFLYSRYGNPTVLAVEETIAALEGADTALLMASGQSATSTALLALLQSGDEIVCSAAIYG